MSNPSTRRYVVPYLPVGSIIGEEELEALASLLRSDATLSCGPQRDAFEREFAAYVGSRYAFSLTNCTVALELATYLLDLQPGDEVIATPQTYQATVQPLLGRADIRVRFGDVEPRSLNIDPKSFAALVTPRTRALFLVHHGGRPADMKTIMRIASASGITVIEDCAHAVGAGVGDRRPGALGDIGCFSFQSYKNITTLGEGGMITFDSDDWAEVITHIRAIEPDAVFRPRNLQTIGPYPAPADDVLRHEKNAYTQDCVALRHPGTNSTLSEPAATVGRIQLRRVEQLVRRRAAIARQLDAALGQLKAIQIQPQPEGASSAHHLYTCFLSPDAGLNRDAVTAAIDAAGVEVQLRYFPVHLLPEWRFRGHHYGECPTTERVWFEQQLNLPIYPQMNDKQVDMMIDIVTDVIASAGGAAHVR